MTIKGKTLLFSLGLAVGAYMMFGHLGFVSGRDARPYPSGPVIDAETVKLFFSMLLAAVPVAIEKLPYLGEFLASFRSGGHAAPVDLGPTNDRLAAIEAALAKNQAALVQTLTELKAVRAKTDKLA